jgi:predicted transcriptional regulator
MHPISLRLDPDMREALQLLANADERSLSSYITLALRDHIKSNTATKRPRITQL